MDMKNVLMVARWEGGGAMGEKVRGLRNTNRELQNSHGDVKYNVGNGVAKELIHVTHGPEQWCGDCLRVWGCWVEGGKGTKLGQL